MVTGLRSSMNVGQKKALDDRDSEDMVDPHSFFYDEYSKLTVEGTEENIQIKNAEGENNEIKNKCKYAKEMDNFDSHEGIFYKRLISLLLSNIRIKEKNDILTVGILEIEVSHSQMQVLENLHTQKISLREVDEILSNAIRKPQYNVTEAVHYFDVILKNFKMALKTIEDHPDGAIIIFVMLMVGVMLKTVTWGRRFSMFVIIQILFVLSFFMTWWQLIQEAEIKSFAEQMKFATVPISCQPDKMNMWDKIVAFVTSNEDCEKYYRVTMSNPTLKITPAYALSHFVTTVILHPITHMGTVVSGFINNATDSLPWAYAWLIRCILFSCVGCVIIVIPFCLTGASFNLGLGPLLRFGIDCRRRNRHDNSLECEKKREPVQIILQVIYCSNIPAITSVPVTEKSKGIEICNTETEKQNNVEKSKSEKGCTDLSCGDTITNTAFCKHKTEKSNCKEVNEYETKKNVGSGDN
ncbi:hypothetical protein WN55_03809 [Dufourea novaeangliae]|uniref:Chloride channel CLIC-like protein 1 n=1 Tax=Dufourea novaeangliae TaxID=178035 RepID=A0A154PKB9_DUFNO|nr:hypothetical protein WN55_03809 [Dufourea novaeangliae]